MLGQFKKHARQFLLPFFIQTIIWDFDGTLYQNEKLAERIKQEYLKLLKNKPFSVKEFDVATEKFGSWSAAVSHLLSLPEIDIAHQAESTFDKTRYIPRNEHIVQLIEKAPQYRHVILSNSTEDQVLQGLSKIGFSAKKNPFAFIIGRDTLKILKPDTRLFDFIQQKTGQKKFQHLVIGDSYQHDILPAEQYGFSALHIQNIGQFFKEA